MTYRLKPLRPIHQSVRKIAISQVDDLLTQHGDDAASPTAVHEARKTIKRLRALLSLIREGLNPGDLEREKQRLREIARMLSGARDAHVRIETAASLQAGPMPRSCGATAGALMSLLQAEGDHAEVQSGLDQRRLPVEAFQEARKAFEALPLSHLGIEQLLDGFTRTYHRGRKLFVAAYRDGTDDEGFHELRKQVQQHWRHLQLLSDAWPKMLRTQVTLAHELAETLGKDHDVSVLAGFVRDNADKISPRRGIETYLRLCGTVQEKLRARTELLCLRLYAEKSGAIRKRIRVYWETAGELGKGEIQPVGNAKDVALNS